MIYKKTIVSYKKIIVSYKEYNSVKAGDLVEIIYTAHTKYALDFKNCEIQ